MRSALTALLLAGVLAAAGCSTDAELDDTEPSRTVDPTSVSSETAATDTPSVVVLVPDVTGLQAGRASVVLTEAGLAVNSVNIMGTACRPRRQVLAQRPRPGTVVEAGRRVRVEVNVGAVGACGLEATRVNEDLQRVARLFVRFSRGTSAGPPTDTPVTLLVGGGQTKVIPGEVQVTRRAWSSCPPAGHYAGRTCPINPIRAIVEHFGPLAFLAQPPAHSCAHPRPVTPGEVGAMYSVTITPDEGLDCTSHWAVELFVNDVGQVVAVNTVLSEP